MCCYLVFLLWCLEIGHTPLRQMERTEHLSLLLLIACELCSGESVHQKNIVSSAFIDEGYFGDVIGHFGSMSEHRLSCLVWPGRTRGGGFGSTSFCPITGGVIGQKDGTQKYRFGCPVWLPLDSFGSPCHIIHTPPHRPYL
jgi:hypothetical protein